MRTRLLILLTALLLLGLPTWSQAQGAITTTTITEPITVTTATTITVASATGITAGIFLHIDNELLRVAQSYVSGTGVPVLRGPTPTTHSDNALTWVVPIGATRDTPQRLKGSCTRGSGDASYTHTFIRSTGAIAVCRLNQYGYTGDETTWIITDASGENGIQSPNPPATQ